MKILVLGSGAREHAIVLSLLSEGRGHEITAAPGNAGIAASVPTVDLDANDPVAVANHAIARGTDLVVIGPEAPLVAGVADELREQGIAVFGPGREAAELEGSKSFAKHVMESAGVPTGRAVRAGTAAEVETALDEFGAPYVVKADGLAAGKGVIVTDDRDAAVAHAHTFLGSGSVLVEEFLDGQEVSLFFVSDGHTVVPLSPAQDFKRAGDGDTGPNTGGMGAYSPLPWLDEVFGSEADFVAEVTETVARPVVRQLAEEQTPFVGLLYAGLILTSKREGPDDRGIRVIEFNARFGDPETQVVLPRLTTPLSELLLAAATGTLSDVPVPRFSDSVAVTVVLASENYPAAPVTGRVIDGVDAAESVEGVHVAHAATAVRDGALVATGGRVLSIVGVGDDFTDARTRVYTALSEITLEGSHHRSDIAARVAR
ncbi:phosphoribosylamine--glycine ligase [Labedella endophytica]|uniref:Phosphoribosylamine--glycine ligase n=1 Tax=Labedella endophytica TaxID=1523160 RepID=A0A3S0Y0P6_9MICO|nr:phosphoribosylamine--glycine ligase [Labedella endophytica]RUR01501.1 phosphoribosylamine--glycine ligase [Labedella endophytica]